MDVVIALGFGDFYNGGELDNDRQHAFVANVKRGIAHVDGSVNAQIAGFSDGGENYDAEPGAWIAATIPNDKLQTLRDWLSSAAVLYSQDSIGLTTPDGFEFVEGN